VPTSRLTTAVLSVARRTGQPVLFVHGNVSSSLFWQPTMLALPEGYRPLAVDLRGFGDTDPEPVDAARGLGDYADDLAAVIEALALPSVHLVGWSMGGGAVLQYLAERPASHRAASVTLVAPVSPYGFGGTYGTNGTLADPAGAGSGAGSVNPDFVARLAAGDRSGESPTSPRQVLLAHYVKPPFVPAELDIFVESMLSTRVGDDHYPGTSRQVAAWPGFAPGDRGGAEHDGADPLPHPRPGRGGTQAAGPVAAGGGRRDRVRHLAVRLRLPGLHRGGSRLAGAGGLAAAADGGADTCPARRLRRGRRAGTARQSSRTRGTARTLTTRSGSWPRCRSTWRRRSRPRGQDRVRPAWAVPLAARYP